MASRTEKSSHVQVDSNESTNVSCAAGKENQFPSAAEFAKREDSQDGLLDQSTSSIESQAILRPLDQVAVAILWGVCFIGAIWFFIDRNQDRGLIDIEKSVSLEAEFLVDINSANWPELMNLPGVGEKTARDIVAHRSIHGDFTCFESLTAVSGIGESTIRQITPYMIPFEQAEIQDTDVPLPKQPDGSHRSEPQ
jgi:competence protein ComEA